MIGLVVLGIVVYLFSLVRTAQPPTFVCARYGCGRVVNHSRRTRSAVAANQRPFCDVCHRKWLDKRAAQAAATAAAGKGCLPMLIVIGLAVCVAAVAIAHMGD